MPAESSSPTALGIGDLVVVAQAFASDRVGLLSVLARIPDPRKPRGVRHRLAVVLGLAVCAVLAGARSYVAIAEWAADADAATLAALEAGAVVACESTFRRTLQRLDAGAFDDAVGAWTQSRSRPGPGGRRLVAVDGKTLRGSAHDGEPGRHLLAALDHTHGVVLGQVDVEAKTNEIPRFSTLMDRVDLADAVVTADALSRTRDNASYGERAVMPLRDGDALVGRASLVHDYTRPQRSLRWNWLEAIDSDRAVDNAVQSIIGRHPPQHGDPYFFLLDSQILRGLLELVMDSPRRHAATAQGLMNLLRDQAALDRALRKYPRSPAVARLQDLTFLSQDDGLAWGGS